MKVLLVDDNAGDRVLLRRCFERHGYEVSEAADGQAGLEAAGSWRPDLIISDALMPVMDGFQFLRRLRQDEELAAIPFIFYSAVYSAEADEQLALSLGADAFIVKPKEPDQFWAEMESCLREFPALERRKGRQVTGQEGESLWRYCCITAHKLEGKVGELEAEAALRRQAEGALR
ncbi:MAG: response regulator, partial [Thermodesulfovibrionales bacterium]